MPAGRGWFSVSGREVLPGRELHRPAAEQELDSLALLAAADGREPTGLRQRRQELVVLAEAEVVGRGAGRERDAVELEHDPAARAFGDVPRIDSQTVGEVEHRVSLRGELLAFFDPQRRPDVAAFAESDAGSSERTGD